MNQNLETSEDLISSKQIQKIGGKNKNLISIEDELNTGQNEKTEIDELSDELRHSFADP